MSNIVDELFQSIDSGRQGKNIGISTGLDKLDGWIGGIQKKTYYLLFGLSGAGKTTFALYSFIYRPLKDNPNGNFQIVYFSLEMSASVLMAKLLSLYLYEEYKVVISLQDLMSYKDTLSDEMYEYVQKGREWLNQISSKLIIYDKSLNRNVFYKKMMEVMEENGKFEETEDRKIYHPYDPNKLILAVVDHVGLLQPISGATKKEEIDETSSRAVGLKERCKTLSFLFLQQENRNSSSMDRRKAEMTECSSEDLKDTGNTFNDCEVCIGVYYALKHRLKTCHDYPIIIDDPGAQFKGLRDRYRGLCLIKNRNGQSEKYDSVNFFGEIGLIEELPKAELITDWTPYIHLTRLGEEIQDETPGPESKKKLTFSF